MNELPSIQKIIIELIKCLIAQYKVVEYSIGE
jgi:hypothetical protein